MNSDGPANALDLERMGVAEVIDFFSVNEKNLLLAVKKVLDDQSYRENARKFGSLLTDQSLYLVCSAVHAGLRRRRCVAR